MPDQPEVTGQWAPMPRRTDPPPPRGPEPEPFETTGAFALPGDLAKGFPPANDPAGAFPPPRGPREDQAGPFETTGAFARPAEWDQNFQGGDFAGPPSGPQHFGQPGPFERPADRPGPLDDAVERTSFFDRQDDDPAGRTAFFDGPDDRPGPFNGPDNRPGAFSGPDNRPGPFNGPDDRSGPTGPFRGPDDRSGPFDGPAERTAFFDGVDDRPGPFDGPGDRHNPFDGPGDRHNPFDDPERTARFDSPSGPVYGGPPPEPGDIKVAGEPTTAMAPAWANADTGFLGSGWSEDSGPEQPQEPRGRRGRRKSGRGGGGGDDVLAAPSGAGKGRVALLSVAAVAVVLGGTVAGVNFMSGSDPATKCQGTTCAAVQGTTSQPAPAASDPALEEEETEPAAEDEEPTAKEPREESDPPRTPTPTITSNVRAPVRTAAPTPTKTKSKKTKEPKEVEEPPADQTASEAPPTEDAPSLSPTEAEIAPPAGTTLEPDEGSFGSSEGVSGSSINVRQKIQQNLTTYSADLTLSNASAATLSEPTVSVPVDGKVVDVDGAEWTQDGDLLILDVSASLAKGASIKVSFTATGRGSQAQNCGMVAGECAIS
ncbi:hypothetical protein AB0I81_19670 [Nonomuraea sp. NPDC050404]|uniref:hypothetical protein n=1 Tax=Nonomuraea sp. NPDC050404 TaxID=3155783 RepID=UPI0033C789C8